MTYLLIPGLTVDSKHYKNMLTNFHHGFVLSNLIHVANLIDEAFLTDRPLRLSTTCDIINIISDRYIKPIIIHSF